MGFISNALKLFKPDDFKDSVYGWLTNQLAHTQGSFLACVFIFSLVVASGFAFNFEPSSYWVGCSVSIFWILWETYHFIVSKNWKDCLEDLFYENSGVLFFYLIFAYLNVEDYWKLILLSYLVIGVTICLYIKRTKK